MVSIKEIISNIKKKTVKDDVNKQQIKDVNYLIECVNNFQSQMGAQEMCEPFLQFLSKLPKEMPLNDELINSFKTIIKTVIDKELAYKEFYIKMTPFQRVGFLYNDYASAKLEKDGSYSISAITDSKELTNYMQNFFLENRKESIIDVIKQLSADKHEKLLHSKINTYYGTQRFILERTKAIFDAINMIKECYQLNVMEYQFLEIKTVEVEECIQKINSVGNEIIIPDRYGDHVTNLTQEEYLEVMVPAFRNLVAIEEELSFISQRIWHEYFEEKDAKFVHALTGGIVESDKMPKICTSLYLNDLATIPYGHVGYEYGVDMDNVDCICECDVGSWVLNKSRFLENGIAHKWQYNEETYMWYEYGYFSKLLPPHYIEQKARENNASKEHISYTEILLMNKTKKIAPVKAFCTDLASPEEIAKITKLAEEQGIELEYIDTKSIKAMMDNKKMV